MADETHDQDERADAHREEGGAAAATANAEAYETASAEAAIADATTPELTTDRTPEQDPLDEHPYAGVVPDAETPEALSANATTHNADAAEECREDIAEVDGGAPAAEAYEITAAEAAIADAGVMIDVSDADANPAAPEPRVVETETARAGTDALGDQAWEEVEAPPKMATADLKPILEALIFASPEPLTPKQMYKLLESEPKEDVQTALAELKRDYERPGGLQLVEVAGGYQIVTRPDLHEWVRRLFHEHSTQKLSVQALETLAVIAYRQPVTSLEIGEIRGVNTSGVLNTLLERHLIKIVGRKQVVGRPFMYGTTKEFLIRFGLNDLSDLPKVQDMAEALGFEAPGGLVEQNPPEEMLPLEEPDEEFTAEDAEDDEQPG